MSNYNNENKKKRNARRFWRTAALILVSVLLSVFAVGALGGLENSPFEKELNPNNLIVVNDAYIKTQNTNRGVAIDVKEDGTIKLSGKATSDHNVTVTTMTLEPGVYTLSGLKNPDINKFYMYLTYGAGQAIAGTDSATFEIETTTDVSVVLAWVNEYEFTNFFVDTKVQPVLVKGESAGNFYAD